MRRVLNSLASFRGVGAVSRSPLRFTAARSMSSSLAAAKELWRTADAVCFDVDSTVCTEEGIDVLAASLGVGEQVAALTRSAMEGGMGYQESLAARMELMAPSKASVDACLEKHPSQLSPKIDTLVKALQDHGKEVWLVSGGFRQLIAPVATRLGVSHDKLVANVLLWDEAGNFVDFDRDQPTSQTGGKAKVVEMLVTKHGLQKVVMVGDGATDMEARDMGPAVAFVGYGGVVTRPTVKAGADWFVTDFQDLIDGLQPPASL